MYRSTWDKESLKVDGQRRNGEVNESVADNALERVGKNQRKKRDRSERLIIHECKVCLTRRKYPVKGYKKLFHDIAPSTVKEV